MSKDENDPGNETPKTLSPGDTLILPLLPLRDIVIFPESLTPLFVGRPRSVAALEAASKGSFGLHPRQIVLSAQRTAKTEDPQPADVFEACTIGVVKTLLLLQNNMMKVLVGGSYRARIKRFVDSSEVDPSLLPDEISAEPFVVEVEVLGEEKTMPLGEKATVEQLNLLQERFEEYARLSKRVQPEVPRNLSTIKEPGRRADVVAGYVPLKPSDKQALLEELDVEKRVKRLIELVDNECDVVRMQTKVRSRFKRSHPPKQMPPAPPQEGAEDIQDEFRNELDNLEKTLADKPLSEEAAERVARELKKLRMMSAMSAEATVVRSYLDWIAMLPWHEYSEDRIDIGRAEAILDEDHYGLEKVKERILEHLAVTKLVDRPKGPILCLVGPPGVGKTSLAKSIARATGREFVRLSLGGVRDESEIRGHRRTYIGALPGKIISSFKRAGTSNPVLLLDEIDKMSTDFRGDPAAALLEVLDPEQNQAFVDHYLDLDYDLSKVLFLCTANSLSGISGPLQDRLEIIRLSGYTDLEKMAIARRYLVPKQLEANGLAKFAPLDQNDESGQRIKLTGADVVVDDSALQKVLNQYTRESGVRNLERQIGTLCRKAAIELLKRVGEEPEAFETPPPTDAAESADEVNATDVTTAEDVEGKGQSADAAEATPPPLPAGDDDTGAKASQEGKAEKATDEANAKKKPAQKTKLDEPDPRKARLRGRLDGEALTIDEERVREYLGTERHKRTGSDGKDLVGVTNGLAWTSSGGELLITEVAVTPGKGKLQITGKLGEVMQESAKAAMTYVRNRARSLGLPRDFYDRIDVHIHVPEGATPKDGPSAGITLATALVSALTRNPVRHDVAMTGEITLRGRVLPIGGLKEKSLAAYRADCRVVIMPAENEKDLADVPELIKEKITFVPVEAVDEVLKQALAVDDPEEFFRRLSEGEARDVFGDDDSVVPSSEAADVH